MRVRRCGPGAAEGRARSGPGSRSGGAAAHTKIGVRVGGGNPTPARSSPGRGRDGLTRAEAGGAGGGVERPCPSGVVKHQ